MSGDGRKLTLVPIPDVVWIPIVQLPWRDDEQDLIPTDTERTAS